MQDLVVPIKLVYTFDEIIYRKKGRDLGEQIFSAIHTAKYDQLAAAENAVFGSNRLNSKIS